MALLPLCLPCLLLCARGETPLPGACLCLVALPFLLLLLSFLSHVTSTSSTYTAVVFVFFFLHIIKELILHMVHVGG